ncbi:MAG: HAMP domain-containing sensor histidine kinase [Gallionella sp.]|nr:HAMP domain-containing sensor histidine kinase [Gallionella sp.]
MSLEKLPGMVRTSIERNTQYIEPRIMVISIIALIGFPLYYFIWSYLFPQPYENWWLRLLGSLLFIPPIFLKYWPDWMSRHKSMYWYLATLYTLPFFFVFMLLKNNGSDVWLSSTLVAIFLMLLWLDWMNVIIQLVLGILLACCAYYLTTDNPHVDIFTLEQIPIYLFAVVVGITANYSAEMLRQERLRAMLATASNIAHELRTPLLGIKSGAAGLRQYLPSLMEGYRLAKEHGLPVESIRQVHLNSMHGVLERIEDEADHSNIIIDMLLMNIRIKDAMPGNFSVCTIGKCVETALRRYPFASEKERQLVVWRNEADFKFRGIELLMVHVMFNLMKNSLYHIAKAGKGEITIQSTTTPQGNTLVFRDTGTGIPPEVLPHIFTRFYSWSSEDDCGLGAGIGLAFCNSVMRSFGGSIRCESQLGEYAEFILTFPFEETL